MTNDELGPNSQGLREMSLAVRERLGDWFLGIRGTLPIGGCCFGTPEKGEGGGGLSLFIAHSGTVNFMFSFF